MLNSKVTKTGANAVVGLGIKNISLVNIFTKSRRIWNAPLRPIKVGPRRLIAYANNLRSVKVTNSIKRIVRSAIKRLLSLISLK